MAGFGETLHQARAHMGVTLKEAEQATRINRHHLAALEEENFAALPPLIYQRGIVRNYASYLQLDPGKLLLMFEEAQGSSGRMPASNVAAVPPIDMPTHWAPNFAIIAFAVVLSAIVFAWVYSAFVAQPDIELTPTAPVPTATPFESDIQPPTRVATEPQVSAEATTAPSPTPSTSSGSRASNDADGASQRRGGDNVRAAETQAEEPAATEAAAIESSQAEETTSDIAREDMTSINVTASEDLYITVTVDGAVAYDGNLAAGESIGYVTGNSFEVYTSWGAQTVFTDACGGDFLMGYENSEATYTLQKQPDSCEPVD